MRELKENRLSVIHEEQDSTLKKFENDTTYIQQIEQEEFFLGPHNSPNLDENRRYKDPSSITESVSPLTLQNQQSTQNLDPLHEEIILIKNSLTELLAVQTLQSK